MMAPLLPNPYFQPLVENKSYFTRRMTVLCPLVHHSHANGCGLRRDLDEAIDEHDDQRQTDIADMIEQRETEVDKERERRGAVAR